MKKKYDPTPEQRKAIEASGNVLVSAAAGAGKTSTLIRRIIREIERGASLNKILVLVFNNAAAAELKESLYQALFEAVCDASGERRERLRRDLDELPFARIGTIHSFCQNLIRENFEKLEISPTFEVTDENRHSVYMKRALDRVFEDYAIKNDETFNKIREIFSYARKEENLRANLIKIWTLADIQPDRDSFIKKAESLYSDEGASFSDILFRSVSKRMAQVKCECESLVGPLINFKEQSWADNMLKLGRAAQSVSECGGLFEAAEIAARGYGADPARRKSRDEEAVALTERAKAVRAFAEKEFKFLTDNFSDKSFSVKGYRQNCELVKKLLEAAVRFDDELKKLKRADNVLSFSDLEHEAAKLIKLGYCENFDAVFVDEYQDVNPTQEHIISHMAAESGLFVGDVKQGIYGFRLADPAIFLARKKRYREGGGTALELTKNFRSAKRILEFVNGVFDCVMTVDSADVDYKGEERFEISSAREGGTVQLHLFSQKRPQKPEVCGLYNINGHINPDESESASEAEGRFIASEISKLVGCAKTEDGIMGFGDVAVLFRSRGSGAQRIINVLKEEGVPVDGAGFVSDDVAPEAELINFLKVIDNPVRDVEFAGFLLSCFEGFDEDELALIAREEGDSFYFKARSRALLDDPLGLKLRGVFSMLDSYRTKAGFKSAAELMRSIISDFSYDAYAAVKGPSAADALSLAVSAAESAENLGAFLKDYATVGASASDRKYAGGDKVRIATYHAFKGLEASAVFIADAASPFSDKSTECDLIADGSGSIGLKYFDTDKKIKFDTLSALAVKRTIRERENKEEMRLLYVALTRAKHYLYVTASPSQARLSAFGRTPLLGCAGCALDFISSAFFMSGAKAPVYIHEGEEPSPRLNAVRTAMLGAPREDVVKEIENSRKFTYPYKEATGLSMKYSVTALESSDETVSDIYSEAAETGTLYHRVMENIDYNALSKKAVELELDRMVAENLFDQDMRAKIKEADILKCLQSPIMEIARRSVCIREKSFMMYLPAKEAVPNSCSCDKVLIQGVVDLYIDGEEKIIVDFKNSRLEDKETLKKYETQLYLYKTALERAFMTKIDKVALYSFKTGKTLYL